MQTPTPLVPSRSVAPDWTTVCANINTSALVRAQPDTSPLSDADRAALAQACGDVLLRNKDRATSVSEGCLTRVFRHPWGMCTAMQPLRVVAAASYSVPFWCLVRVLFLPRGVCLYHTCALVPRAYRDTGCTQNRRKTGEGGGAHVQVGRVLSFIGDATLARCVGEDRVQPWCAALCCGRYFPC
jgi:hypothetical protein